MTAFISNIWTTLTKIVRCFKNVVVIVLFENCALYLNSLIMLHALQVKNLSCMSTACHAHGNLGEICSRQASGVAAIDVSVF